MTADPSELLRIDQADPPGARASPTVAMQRVVVRLLFDPAFVEAVYADADAALAGLELPAGLVAQLLTQDKRLWGADRLRRRRALKVLMEEFKVSTALALQASRSLARLEAFFSSPDFHEAVQRRGYMALAFRAWLPGAHPPSPELDAVLALEGAMAEARRERRDARRGWDWRAPDPEASGWLTAPGIRLLRPLAGTLDIIAKVEEFLFEASLVPALALCDDAPRLDALPALGPPGPPLLLEADAAGQVEVNGVGEEYAALIAACHSPQTEKRLRQSLRGAGLGRSRIRGMIEALEGAGVLRRLGE